VRASTKFCASSDQNLIGMAGRYATAGLQEVSEASGARRLRRVSFSARWTQIGFGRAEEHHNPDHEGDARSKNDICSNIPSEEEKPLT